MWNKDKSIEYVNSHALGASTGRCAEAVRKAVEAGGVNLARHNSAKDYGPSLQAVGFARLGSIAAFTSGDVVVIDSFPGNTHGHIAIFNGLSWVSDFKQSGLYPGPGYRQYRPAYSVYRYGETGSFS
jgi:hypothetical protein